MQNILCNWCVVGLAQSRFKSDQIFEITTLKILIVRSEVSSKQSGRFSNQLEHRWEGERAAGLADGSGWVCWYCGHVQKEQGVTAMAARKSGIITKGDARVQYSPHCWCANPFRNGSCDQESRWVYLCTAQVPKSCASRCLNAPRVDCKLSPHALGTSFINNVGGTDVCGYAVSPAFVCMKAPRNLKRAFQNTVVLNVGVWLTRIRTCEVTP